MVFSWLFYGKFGMDIHQIPWNTMIYHEIPWLFVPFNVSWFFMENHEHFTLKYHAEPWTYKLEIPWHTMKILTWKTMKYHEMLLPWNFDEKNIMVIHEKVCHLTRWMFMLCHGISWYLMIIHAINSMKYHENTMENHEISCLKKAGYRLVEWFRTIH